MEHVFDDSQRLRSETSLGPSIERQGGCWTIDLTDLPIFHGLSILSMALGEMIIAQANSDRIDITVERKVSYRENPELLKQMGISLIKVSAERAAITKTADDPETFQDRLRAILGTL